MAYGVRCFLDVFPNSIVTALHTVQKLTERQKTIGAFLRHHQGEQTLLPNPSEFQVV